MGLASVIFFFNVSFFANESNLQREVIAWFPPGSQQPKGSYVLGSHHLSSPSVEALSSLDWLSPMVLALALAAIRNICKWDRGGFKDWVPKTISIFDSPFSTLSVLCACEANYSCLWTVELTAAKECFKILETTTNTLLVYTSGPNFLVEHGNFTMTLLEL